MANFKYFADLPTGTVEFKSVDYISAKNIRGYDAATKSWVQISRKVEFKAQPSRHVCDDRCVNATGRVMKCECSCGGKNHGKGNSGLSL